MTVRIGKMEFIPFKKDAKGHYSFSQQTGIFAVGREVDFAARGRFHSRGHFGNIFTAHFAVAKLGYRAAKWHSCANGFLQLRNGGFQGMEVSQPFRSCEMGVRGCEIALVCQGVTSQLRKFS